MATETTQTTDTAVSGSATPVFGSTPRQNEARRSITRTMVTPAPGQSAGVERAVTPRSSLLGRFTRSPRGELTPARRPYPGCSVIRLILSILMSVLCLLTVGGSILVLMLWQQDRASGVLATQVDRTWDLFDLLRQTERVLAFALVPLGAAWLALAAINVFRASGRRRNPIVAAASLPVGVFGAWLIGARVVAEADDWVGQASGFVLQAVFLAIPLLALERIAEVGDARHGPLRASYLIGVVYLAQMQFLGGLSTVDQASAADHWGKLGAYLLIGGLIQVLGTIAITEAARSIEDSTENRFQLRQRFGESLLAQAGLA
jgi:hypothetical protein